MACNSHTAASLEGTADTPISLSCRDFARYVVVTLPGSGRSLALREIDVFAIENADGSPCLTEYPLFPGAPPAPQPPPAAAQVPGLGHLMNVLAAEGREEPAADDEGLQKLQLFSLLSLRTNAGMRFLEKAFDLPPK